MTRWRFDQLGVLVADVDRTVSHFESVGFAPSAGVESAAWPGLPEPVELRQRILARGDMTLKLHSPIEGKGLPTDFLARHGEGVFYIGFAVEDLIEAANEMVQEGFPVIHRIEASDGTLLTTFHDTRRSVDLMTALISPQVSSARSKSSSSYWILEHVGLIVSDMTEALDSFRSLGFSVVFPPVALLYPVPTEKQLTVAHVVRDGFVVELMKPFGDENLWARFLREHRGGINHLSFAVENLEEEHQKMVAKGYEVTSIARNSDDSLQEVYYDTSSLGNLQICLYKYPPRITYEDTMRYLMEIGALVGREEIVEGI